MPIGGHARGMYKNIVSKNLGFVKILGYYPYKTFPGMLWQKNYIPPLSLLQCPCMPTFLLGKRTIAERIETALRKTGAVGMTVQILAETVSRLPANPAYAGKSPRLLLVGGFVRDALMGIPSKDMDAEVYGVSPERLEKLLEEEFPHRVNKVGKSFGVYKVSLRSGETFDISFPRRESKSGRGHRGFRVEGDPSMSIEDAARRRDFTFNAMAADPLTGDLADPFGGLRDLAHQRLRMTDAERFPDDPLRVYRALQFAARFDLMTETDTRETMREMVARGDMNELPKERITGEMEKLLLAKKQSVGWELAKELGLIQRYYPELHALIGAPQDPEWHPEGDVWTHTIMTLDEAAGLLREQGKELTRNERLQVMLGSLCHDLGKPQTTRVMDGRIRAPGHAEAGAEEAKYLLSRWTFPEDAKHAAVVITKEHLAPRELFWARERGDLDDANYANAVRRLIKRIAPVSWRVLVLAAEADHRGRAVPGIESAPYAAGQAMTQVILRHGFHREPAQPLLLGRDLLALGLEPSPRFSELLRTVEDERDLGRICSKEEAITFVRNLLHRKKDKPKARP